MGTTATAALVSGGSVVVGQVGDSRAYLLRQGRLGRLTRDQSLAQQLLEQGVLQPEDLATFEHGNIILQAVGSSSPILVDLTWAELRRGDVLMLCSDGLWGEVDDRRIAALLLAHPAPEEACRRLVDAANEAGGSDNITCVVARFDGPGLKPLSPEDPELKYRKYILPSEPNGQATIQEGPSGASGDRASSTPGKGRSNSQVHVTLVGNLGDILSNLSPEQRQAFNNPGSSDASGRSNNPSIDEQVELPINRPPAWVVVAALLCAVAVVGAAAVFLLK
jgi:protein phosphatase